MWFSFGSPIKSLLGHHAKTTATTTSTFVICTSIVSSKLFVFIFVCMFDVGHTKTTQLHSKPNIYKLTIHNICTLNIFRQLLFQTLFFISDGCSCCCCFSRCIHFICFIYWPNSKLYTSVGAPQFNWTIFVDFN